MASTVSNQRLPGQLVLAISLVLSASINATGEEELPPLELLGFIADFSNEREGWVDSGLLEEMLAFELENGQGPGEAGSEAETETEAETARQRDEGQE